MALFTSKGIADNAAGTVLAAAFLALVAAVGAVFKGFPVKDVALVAVTLFAIAMLVTMIVAIRASGRQASPSGVPGPAATNAITKPVRWLGFTPSGGRVIFLVNDTDLKETDVNGSAYYNLRNETEKEKIHELLLTSPKNQFLAVDFAFVVDKKEWRRLFFAKLINDGNQLLALPNETPWQERMQKADVWEKIAIINLGTLDPSSQGDFTRPVGPQPEGVDAITHRLGVLIERLVHIKNRI